MASILILEDDEISARLASRMLQKNSHLVHLAAKSDAAWVKLRETAVDLLLLDTQLEGEYGYDVLATIRGDALFRDLPVVVYSSVARREIVQRYLSLGVEGILVKPASAERINQEVDRITKVLWRTRLFESEETVQVRTGLMPAEVDRLYHESAEEMRATIPELELLAEDLSHAPGLAKLTALKGCAVNIGFLRLAEMVERMQKAVDAGNAAALKPVVAQLPAALRLLVRHSGREESVEAAAEGSAAPYGT